MTGTTIETTDYAGIDYGMGLANIDDSGIRNGVISTHHVEWWHECAEAVCVVACPNCGEDLIENHDLEDGDDCPVCGEELNDDRFYYTGGATYEKEGYAAESGEDGDIFVCKSPYFTYAQFCSPCAPGACYLINPLDESARTPNNKAYCFGHDWFDGSAPYPVFSVETGEEIPAKK